MVCWEKEYPMNKDNQDSITSIQRKIAVETFNTTWDVIDIQERSEADELRMLHLAHTSRFLWGEVGDPVNYARGDWLLSRVYALLGYGELAFRFGEQSLAWCEKHAVEDFDLAFAYEVLARACLVSGDREKAVKYISRAKSAGDKIADPGDRKFFFYELDQIQDK
jgi:hypothetical protein